MTLQMNLARWHSKKYDSQILDNHKCNKYLDLSNLL